MKNMPRKGLKSVSQLDDSKNGTNSNDNINSSLIDKSDIDESKKAPQENDIVWAKMKGYPFWPARITELVYRKKLNDSSSDKKKIPTEPKEYKVVFFGGNTTGSVYKDNLKYFNGKEKSELIAKYSKNSKMTRAIEEAEEYLKNPITNTICSKEKIDNNLLSMDEELKLIKNAVDLKLENLNEDLSKSVNEGTKTKSPADSKKKLPIQIDKLCQKKEQRSSAVKAARNLSSYSADSQLKQQRDKISKMTGEDLDKLCSSAKKTYELIKSSTKPKEKKSKKRNRSFDENEQVDNQKINNSKKKCLYKQFESEDEELNFRVEEDKKFAPNDYSFSRSSSPVDLSLEMEPSNFKFSSMTVLIDSGLKIYKNYILKLFDVFYEMMTESNEPSSIIFYDITDDESDLNNVIKTKLQEIKEKCYSRTQLNVIQAKELDKSIFDTDIVFSFIEQPKNDDAKFNKYEKFEKLLLSSDLNELKIVSFCPIDYQEVVIYHHHLKSNNGLFIEAPIIEIGNFSKILIACLDESFFKAFKHLFDSLFESENVIYEGDELGYPSMFCVSVENYLPLLKLFKMVSNKVINLIPQLMSVKCIDKTSQDVEMDQIKNKFTDKIVKGSKNIFNWYLEKDQTEIENENKNELKLELNKLLDSL